MSDAQPENWDDKTGVNGDNSDIKPFSGEQAELDKTKCFKLKWGQPKKEEIVDLVTSSDESVLSAPSDA